MDSIWSTSGDTYTGEITIREALADFARNYWAKPRQAMKLGADGTFQMRGGAGRIYSIDRVGRTIVVALVSNPESPDNA